MIPCFNIRLRSKFNHLTFIDDLIIITQAFKDATKYCKLCLNMCKNLIGQSPNFFKSTLRLPSWCNMRIAYAIRSILDMLLGFFPFKYLGVLISPKRLFDSKCSYQIYRVSNYIKSWSYSKISIADCTVFINSSFLSIPAYLISCHSVSGTTLDCISMLARNSFGVGVAIVAV